MMVSRIRSLLIFRILLLSIAFEAKLTAKMLKMRSNVWLSKFISAILSQNTDVDLVCVYHDQRHLTWKMIVLTGPMKNIWPIQTKQ